MTGNKNCLEMSFKACEYCRLTGFVNLCYKVVLFGTFCALHSRTCIMIELHKKLLGLFDHLSVYIVRWKTNLKNLF